MTPESLASGIDLLTHRLREIDEHQESLEANLESERDHLDKLESRASALSAERTSIQATLAALQQSCGAEIESPTTVFEHLVLDWTRRSQPLSSVCGKVWRPSDGVVSAGRCPDCQATVDGMWSA